MQHENSVQAVLEVSGAVKVLTSCSIMGFPSTTPGALYLVFLQSGEGKMAPAKTVTVMNTINGGLSGRCWEHSSVEVRNSTQTQP